MGNEAAQYGGGIACRVSSEIEPADGVAVENCFAGYGGGGIFLRTESTLLAKRNVPFVGNQASGGGGIYCSKSSVIELADAVEGRDCTAGNGVGIWLQTGSSLRMSSFNLCQDDFAFREAITVA